MASDSTLGWSVLSSGLVTLALVVLPGDSRWWGVGLCVLGAWLLARNAGSRY